MPQDTPHASWPELVGDNMIQAPDMSASEPWGNQPTGCLVNDITGKMIWTAVAAGEGPTNDGTPASAFISAARYLVSRDISGLLAGEVAIALGDEVGISWGGNGTDLSEVLVAADPMGDGFRIFNSSGGAATLSLDNVSVKTFQGMGQEASWALTGGDVRFLNGPDGVSFDSSPEGDNAVLTGGSKAAFDAAVTDSTACTVSLTAGIEFVFSGTVQVKMKGGTAVDFTFVGDPGEVITHTVTSDTGSGFELIAGPDNPTGRIVLIRIALA